MADSKKAEIREKKLRVRQELLDLLQGLSEAQWETAVYLDDQTWSITDLLRHVVNAERGMTGLITQFQQGNNPVPPDFDRERYNLSTVRKAQEKSPHQLITELETNQAQYLSALDSLADEDWGKTGRHASLRIMSIEEILHLIPHHEESHLVEMRTALQDAKAASIE
jgi:uncharacterized protein (TIGR03083 family)